ncbi:hypothetical protein A2631_04610 [Candidatus Daviesbacteria bacterium RIFCSPHIGHO2_01_FULL_44_29]|uniref:Asparaginase n=1 Tax=Candidatus Daviesbacteria bacterium RIFCSPHIGHO2_02_FULL_43_12 TaxID=1797776 RepID=A0A1F5KGE0_9BACT|nr:MAG: hypothetical protein A2631_04610 [Candidatus Daviesbacteria bacterium RIFCSPHIGHO2_01_FULL_44_29]OGE40002.1 MAG: hypothetical protein A3D25_04340 [Candidatus Daviesbacteria bacterium RIFCSPHIGHO2_02_FULL_43_12]OGE70317.1 MAG: hypothetical protein A3B55_01230 [Candidatus Daviesbacteria bacterium RIFCSPLOWO2_01_FULL_43_15]
MGLFNFSTHNPVMTNKIFTYSENPHKDGKVLVLSLGGLGIERPTEDLNFNLRESLDLVPYLKDEAGRIDCLALSQKDSADLTSFEIADIAKTIKDYQNDYDGFVVIGGMDVAAYYTCATAFALRGLGAPVIFTGATQSARDPDSDFRLNLPNAIKVSLMGAKDVNAPSVGEVAILFDDSLTRATVATNRGTRSNNPILSPRVPKIGDVGWTVKISSHAVPRKPSQVNYSYNTNVNVAYFDLVSETHLGSFEQLVTDDTIQGIIIGAFGAGNCPAKLIPLIYRAVYEKAKLIGVITNCKKGSSDMGLYDVGAVAVKAGAISLGPMVKPAAIEKMRYALSNAQGEDKFRKLQDASRLLLTAVAEEIPDTFSRHMVNNTRDQFIKTAPTLDSFFKPQEDQAFSNDIKTYCKSKTSKYKILTISLGGTFFQEPNLEGVLAPTKKTLQELFDVKLKGIDRLTSLDYLELVNIDSSNMEHRYRAQLARVIAKNIDKYDGVVVLHGTDTLAYTAAAISYMLVGIDKDVILTGAQKPGFGSSDFDRNFVKSIKAIFARLEQPKESRAKAGVKVAFGDKLMIGTTVVKEDEHGINAFAPIEKHPLAGTLSHHVEIIDILDGVKKRPFNLFTGFNQKVAYFECISAVDIKQFESYVESDDISAILVGGYDEANMPMQMKYYIATAVNSYHKPICIIATTDNGVAEIALDKRRGEFIKAGGIALGDMIKESAYQKLCFALGIASQQKKMDGRERLEFIRKIMHTNLTGEISDKYCSKGDQVYKGIFTDRVFTDEFIQEAINNVRESFEKDESSAKQDSTPEKSTKR